MILFRKIKEADRKAQVILADLILLVEDEALCQDAEFIAALSGALEVAERRSSEAKSSRLREESKPKAVSTTVAPRNP